MQNIDLQNLGNVLVTGGTGFVGSALVKRLVNEGLKVSVLDNNSRGNIDRLNGYLEKIKFYNGDVTSLENCLEACEGIDTLFHLAAINGTENFYKIPAKVLKVGVKGALNSVEAAIQCGVTKYIVTSSSEVYQEPVKVPTDEKERIIIPDIHNPRFSYSIGKIMSEAIAIHSPSEKLKTIICRPHNFYGPDMGTAHVIPQFILRMKKLSNDFNLKNIDLPIHGTGKETRSFCFVTDGVEGLIVAASNGSSKEIYHIGTEVEISIAHLAKITAQLLGIEINIVMGDSLPGGTQRRCPNINKIRKIGFEPKTTLEVGIKATINWYLNNSIVQHKGEVIK